jgi:hypothetical protein
LNSIWLALLQPGMRIAIDLRGNVQQKAGSNATETEFKEFVSEKITRDPHAIKR